MMKNENEFEKLKLLFEYTKFHIGLYAGTSPVLLAFNLLGDKLKISIDPIVFLFSIGFLVLAGVAASTICTNLYLYNSLDEFLAAKIGPFHKELITTQKWIYIEHASFWISIGLIMISMLLSIHN